MLCLMAIAFARTSIHTRSKGHSSVAAAAYRSATKLTDERTGIVYDFTNRKDVIYSEIILPEGTTANFKDRSLLWNTVENIENRKNSQVCKDFVLALPKEIDLVKQIELAKRFAQTHFIDNGIPVDLAIHDHGDGNPHAHLLVTTRRLEFETFATHKARDLNPTFAKGFVVEKDYWNEQWRDLQNDFFNEHDIDLTVDINHIVSERHEGKVRDDINHYVSQENEIVKIERERIALENPENIINILSLENSVFTKRDIENLVFKTLKTPDASRQFSVIVERILNSSNIIELGLNDHGRASYTTRGQYLQEAKLLKNIEALNNSKSHIHTLLHPNLIQNYSLNDEQQKAFSFITNGSDISALVGKPGTGKSFILKPLKEHYQSHGYRIIGCAISGKVAKALQADTKINALTISALSNRLLSGKLKLTNKDVLIIDEAGMVDFYNMAFVLEKAHEAKAKVILTGDPDQLNPIKKGAIFRGIIDRIGYISLENIKRQRNLKDQQASMDYAQGNIAAALEHYHSTGAIHFDASEALINNMIENWGKQINHSEDLPSHVLMAFKSESVNELNIRARNFLIEKEMLGSENYQFDSESKSNSKILQNGNKVIVSISDEKLGLLGGATALIKDINQDNIQLQLDSGKIISVPIHLKSYLLPIKKSAINISKGERLMLTRNNRSIGVKNGDLGTVINISQKNIHLKLDSGELINLPRNYKHISYGYALTVHKSQGMTVKKTSVLIDSKYWNRALGFVGMTRHRDELNVFVDSNHHENLDQLTKTLSRKPTMDNVIDWPLDYATRKGFDPDKLIGRAINHIAGVANTIKDKFNYIVNYESYLKQQAAIGNMEHRKTHREMAKYTADYLDCQARVSKLHNTIRHEAKALGVEMSDLPAFEKLYTEARIRDKQAYDLWHNHADKLKSITIDPFKLENIERASSRYERLLIVKEIAENFDEEPKANPKLAEKATKIIIKDDYAYVKRQAYINKMKPADLCSLIEKYQLTHRHVLYEKIKQEYPIVAHYDTLVAQRKSLKGSAAIEADKKLFAIAKQILKDKTLHAKISEHLPKFITRLEKRIAHVLGKDRDIDR